MGWATQRGPRPRLVATSHRLASCMIVSGFRTPLDLNTYPLRNLILPQCTERAKPGRGKPVLIMHIGFFACFHAHISRTQSFQQNRHISFLALVALKLLVSLISRLVACSARIVVDRQTNRQTHRTTTVTLAAHARQGLKIIMSPSTTSVYCTVPIPCTHPCLELSNSIENNSIELCLIVSSTTLDLS